MSSGKFVRASKYRHVFGTQPKNESIYGNIRPQITGEGNHIDANEKFFALPIQGGGGPVLVHRLDKPGRLDHNPKKVNLHKAKVVDVKFSPFIRTLLATASEDCMVKLVKVPEEGLDDDINDALATLEGHQKKLSLLGWNPTANNILASCSYDQDLKIWDIEKQAVIFDQDAHTDQIQCFEWNSNGSQIVTTCKDKQIRLYDPRKPKAVTVAPDFQGAKSSKIAFVDNHNALFSVGFSKTSMRQYSYWDQRDLSKPFSTSDIDQAAGVLSLYYDSDSSVMFVYGKGDGVIRYFEITDEAPHVFYLADFRHNESQKGCCFVPKLGCDYQSCEIDLCLRLMRDSVVPISFKVPRKSDVFQKDLYPDTYAGIPGVEAAAWAEGKNGEIKTQSVQDAVSGGGEIAFKVQKSAKELQAELEAANKTIEELRARIKELEAK